MAMSYSSGFTIIETVLFLAVTGLLIIGVLTGVGSSINSQRYRDSVQSLQTTIQDQYSEVMSVRNETPAQTLRCDSNATVTVDVSGNKRGQATCVLLGQYITSTSGGSQLSTARVVGYVDPSAAIDSNDLTNLRQYALNIIPSSVQTYDVEWGARLFNPRTTNPLTLSVLIVRSPSSGIVRTFVDTTAAVPVRDIETLVSTAHLSQEARICVDGAGLFANRMMGVLIPAGATSGSGVEVLPEGNSGC
jgi:type II secretory pathway pseudopilin PulG